MIQLVIPGSHSRRTFLAAAGTASVVGAAVTGCSSPGGSKGDAVTLTMWTWCQEGRTAFEGGILEAYESANPGVRVEVQVQRDKDYETLLTTGLSGSGGLDIAAIRSFGVISTFAETRDLVALDDIVENSADFSDQATARYQEQGRRSAVRGAARDADRSDALQQVPLREPGAPGPDHLARIHRTLRGDQVLGNPVHRPPRFTCCSDCHRRRGHRKCWDDVRWHQEFNRVVRRATPRHDRDAGEAR